MQTNTEPGGIRAITGRALITLLGLVLAASAIVKLAKVPKVVTQLAALGFSGDRLTLIAILEIVSAALLLVRSTRALGLLLLSAFLGGAIAVHVGHGETPFQPAIVLALLWLGTWLRHPVVFWSLQDEVRLAPGQRPEGVLSQS